VSPNDRLAGMLARRRQRETLLGIGQAGAECFVALDPELSIPVIVEARPVFLGREAPIRICQTRSKQDSAAITFGAVEPFAIARLDITQSVATITFHVRCAPW
jgi:hypothetical protein